MPSRGQKTQISQPPEVAQPAPRPQMTPTQSERPPGSLVGQHVSTDSVLEHERYHTDTAHRVAATAQGIEGDKPTPHSAEAARLAAQYHEQWGEAATAPARVHVETPQSPSPYQPTLPHGAMVDESLHRPAGHMITLAPPAAAGGTTRVMHGGRMELASPAPTPRPDDPDLTAWIDQDPAFAQGHAQHMVSDEERDSATSGQPDAADRDYTVGELVDYLETVSDTSQLDELEADENDRPQGPRRRALAAITDRRHELEQPQPGQPAEPTGDHPHAEDRATETPS